MIDKDTSTQFDDSEFHFDEFDHSDETPASTASTNTAGLGVNPKAEWADNVLAKKNPRKLVVIGIIVLVLIGFIVYHFTSSEGSFGSWSTPATKVAAVPANTNPVISPAQPPQLPLQQVTTELTNKINTVDQTVNQQQQTITQLQSNISTMQDSINTLNANIDTVTEQLAALNQKLTKPVQKKVVQPAGPPPVSYIVQAMVPGRAWLKGSDGTSLTVSAGSAVPAHGEVTNVDLRQGQVTTSDGSTFSYDINGN